MTRHRLNRGGNRQANHALYQVLISRLASDPETKRYVQRRTKEGKSIGEIVRMLKRYIAREVFTPPPHQLTSPQGVGVGPEPADAPNRAVQ